MTDLTPPPHWEILLATGRFTLRRRRRSVVCDLNGPHAVMSTSAVNGGQTFAVRHLVNHQSCEGAEHVDRFRAIKDRGVEAYHDDVCREAGVEAAATAMMGTAANMHYSAIVTRTDLDVAVTAVVTAGVEGNAATAGDPAAWRETGGGTERVPYDGTINTMLLISHPLTPGTLARVVVTMTEGKSAALQRLAVPSRQSVELATGTGTDQFAIAAPVEGGHAIRSASPHMKFGEVVGAAVRDATEEALRWQNGLEKSYTRSVFHALGRYGVKEATAIDEMAADLDPADLALLKKNSKALFYEPLVGAAAYALAAVLDRARHGVLPESVLAEALIQQAATLAASAAGAPDRWPEFRARLHGRAGSGARALALAALALGWSEKWRTP
jgi:adenosylcobinamide amidohydrolase